MEHDNKNSVVAGIKWNNDRNNLSVV